VPLVGVFLFLFVAYVAFIVVGVPLTVLILLTVPALCITLAFSVHNDLALDNTAVWLHISAGKLGIPDRAGRMAPILGIGIPLIAIGSVVSAYFASNYGALPALLGVSTCLLLAGLGVGNVLSAAFPYPAVRPGDSPFAQPQAPAGSGFMVQVGFIVVTFVLAAPSIVFAVLGLLGSPGLLWTSLWWGVGVGLVTVVAGTALGGATFDRRGPELLAAALRN
jgi:ABC-2 type transport system permease protein